MCDLGSHRNARGSSNQVHRNYAAIVDMTVQNQNLFTHYTTASSPLMKFSKHGPLLTYKTAWELSFLVQCEVRSLFPSLPPFSVGLICCEVTQPHQSEGRLLRWRRLRPQKSCVFRIYQNMRNDT